MTFQAGQVLTLVNETEEKIKVMVVDADKKLVFAKSVSTKFGRPNALQTLYTYAAGDLEAIYQLGLLTIEDEKKPVSDLPKESST